jgi:hypothetical protein
VCKFRVAAGKALDEAPYKLSGAVAKLASITFWSIGFFPTGRLNLGFITEGKLAAILIKPSLGVSNWPVIYFINYTPTSSLAPFITAPSNAIKFFWRRCQGKRRLLQGEFHTHILYFVLSFAFTLFLLASFYKK